MTVGPPDICYHRRMTAAVPTTAHRPGTALRAAKLALRARCLAARDALSGAEHQAASAAIAAGIARLPSFVAAPAVLLTLAFRSEWDTRRLVDAALAAGKIVAMPRVDPVARMLDLHVITDPDGDIERGYQGIPEPRRACPMLRRDEITWVLVPGIAFDRSGARMGYGGGYYDRLLPLLPALASRVAGAFDLQLVERVPMAPHDFGVDTIVTETGALACRPGHR